MLTPHGFMSPYSVLVQGGCHYITNQTVSSSTGDISVVWLNGLRKNYQLRVGFSTKLSSCGHDFCYAYTLQPHPLHTKTITMVNKEGPSIQVLTFYVSNPNDNIHLNFHYIRAYFQTLENSVSMESSKLLKFSLLGHSIVPRML